MSNEMTVHDVTKIKLTENKYTSFSTINVTATDKKGNSILFKMFVDSTDKLEYSNEVEVE